MFSPISTAVDFEKRVVFGQTIESKYLDFKASYAWQGPGKKEEDAVEFARDVAQFANTEGGTLVIGVSEGRTPERWKVAAKGPGVPDPAGLRGWLEQAISNHIAPATLTHRVEQFRHGGKTIVAVNVPPSIHLVAVWDRHKPDRGIEYMYRTDHGKDWMNPDEVERHLMNGSRSSRLAVKRVWDELGSACANRIVELVPPVKSISKTQAVNRLPPTVDIGGELSRPRLTALREHELELFMASGAILRVPYTLVIDAWATVDQRPALALSVRIVGFEKQYHLEPL